MAVSFLRDLGPCEVSWGGAVLGTLNGPVKVKVDDQDVEIKENGMGVVAVDAVFVGRKFADIEVPLTRITIDQLSDVFHGTVLVDDVLTISNVVGESMYDSSLALLLKPLINDVAGVDVTEWIELFKTFPTAKIELPYDNASQRNFVFSFKVFPSQESGQKGEFGTFGHA